MRAWTVRELAALREMRARGLGQGACARLLGRTRASVQGALRRMGLTGAPAPSGRVGRNVAGVVARVGVAEAAWRYGVSRQAVYAALKRRAA